MLIHIEITFGAPAPNLQHLPPAGLVPLKLMTGGATSARPLF